MYFYYKKLAIWTPAGAVEHKKGTKNTQTQASHGVLRRNQYKSTCTQQAEFVLPEHLFDPVLYLVPRLAFSSPAACTRPPLGWQHGRVGSAFGAMCCQLPVMRSVV